MRNNGAIIPKQHAFHYIATRLFNQSNQGRVALPRPYTVPKTNIAGSAGIFVQRSMEVYKPAIAYGNQTILTNSPAGNAGNSPLSSTPGFSPLVNTYGTTGQFASSGALGT